MSALQERLGYKNLDPGHWLIELVRMVQPHLSHLVKMPTQEPILDADGNETTAICHHIDKDKHHVMTSKGMAYVDRTLFDRKAKPRLMSHHSIALIMSRALSGIIFDMEVMLAKQIKSYGVTSIKTASPV